VKALLPKDPSALSNLKSSGSPEGFPETRKGRASNSIKQAELREGLEFLVSGV